MKPLAKLFIFSLFLLDAFVISAQWTKLPDFNGGNARLLYSQGKLVASDEQLNSTFQLRQSTRKWEKVVDKSGSSFSYDISHVDSLFWISTPTGFLYSNQNGSDWKLYGDTLISNNYHQSNSSIAVLPPKTKGLPYRLFSGTLGIGFFKSLDGGHKWTEIDSTTMHNHDILDLKTHIFENGKIDFFMINLNGVFESVDEGETWIKSDSAATVVEPRKLYYLNNQWFLTAGDGLYRRDLNKRAWYKCTTKLSFAYIITDMVSLNSVIYAGHPLYGILKSSDNGETWTVADSFAPGINSDRIDIGEMTLKEDTLIVGAGAKGIWQSKISDLASSVNNITKNPSYFKFYPNPFTSSSASTFKYNCESTGFVKIVITDAAGRIVDTRVNKEMEAGTHEVAFSPTNSSNGIYFATIFFGSKKMNTIKLIQLNR